MARAFSGQSFERNFIENTTTAGEIPFPAATPVSVIAPCYSGGHRSLELTIDAGEIMIDQPPPVVRAAATGIDAVVREVPPSSSGGGPEKSHGRSAQAFSGGR